jgi:hypothetical protein
MKKTKKKSPSSSISSRSKKTFKKIAAKKNPSKSTALSSVPKGAIAASKDSWLEYLAITPSFFIPSDPKRVFISGWGAGVDWAMRTIHGPNYKG